MKILFFLLLFFFGIKSLTAKNAKGIARSARKILNELSGKLKTKSNHPEQRTAILPLNRLTKYLQKIINSLFFIVCVAPLNILYLRKKLS